MLYRVPFFTLDQSAGPNPMENSCTQMPNRRAARKWPSSCTSTTVPKTSTVAIPVRRIVFINTSLVRRPADAGRRVSDQRWLRT